MKYFLFYFVIINIYALIIMYRDKRKAQEKAWRTPEATLFAIAVFLGSPGILLGMYMFHHKTKHMKFVLGIPAIMIIQIVIMIMLIRRRIIL